MSEPALEPVFRHRLRVYWEDTDAGGVVFYANYLKFFERARTEWLRSLGIGQQALREATGAIFVVSDTQVRYLRPARLDDAIEATVHVRLAGRVQLEIDQQALRLPQARESGCEQGGPSSAEAGTELLAEGRIRIACVDAASFKPRRIPEELQAALMRSPRSPTSPR